MAEYIDRNMIFSVWRSMPGPASADSLIAAIHQTPPADVTPVRNGMWIFGEFDVLGAPVRCSECGYGADRVDPIMWATYPGHRFCGCCGAKMDGDGNV